MSFDLFDRVPDLDSPTKESAPTKGKRKIVGESAPAKRNTPAKRSKPIAPKVESAAVVKRSKREKVSTDARWWAEPWTGKDGAKMLTLRYSDPQAYYQPKGMTIRAESMDDKREFAKWCQGLMACIQGVFDSKDEIDYSNE